MPTSKTNDLSVNDVLELIKNPSNKGNCKGKCILVRKMETLPDNIKEALNTAMADRNVSNRDIVSFISNHTDIQVTYTNVMDHRAKAGCLTCLYGGTR